MNWFEKMEQRRTLLVSGIVLICLATLMVTARRAFYSYDGFWHLQAGLDWLEQGLSPWLDHFSFTFNGGDVRNPPWMFQAMLGWLVKQFGLESGFQIFRFVSFSLLFGLFIVFLRRLRAPTIAYCLVLPLVVVLLQFRVLVRPELLAYSFSVLAIILYHRTRNEISTAGMLPILALMLLWNSYHTPIIGYVIFFGFFVDIGLKNISNKAPVKSWMKWLGWGLAIVAVGFLNSSFTHPLLGFLNFSSDWARLITEYFDYSLYLQGSGLYALIAMTSITIALLLWKRQVGLLIVSAVLIYSSAHMSRLITPGGIVILGIFAWMICEIDFEIRFKRLSAFPQTVIGGVALALLVLALGSAVFKARDFMMENRYYNERHPADVVDYIIENKISGRIFNDFANGGYLIYRLSPVSQVYIDGRTNILYPIDHLDRYIEALKSPDVLRAEVEKYDIQLAILANRLDPFTLIYESGTLGLDFVGGTFSAFRKNSPNFPVLGKLLVLPACWKENFSAALEIEQERAIAILPDDSMLLPFAEFVTGYTHAENRAAYLGAGYERGQRNVAKLRFAGYQALDYGMYQTAVERFAGFPNWEFRDFLASAIAYFHLKDWKKAEQLLDTAARHAWPSMKLEDLVILHGLLDHIRENVPLEFFDDAYVTRLAEQINAGNEPTLSTLPDSRSFCPDT